MREQLAARDFIASRRIRTRVPLDILQPVDPLSPKECRFVTECRKKGGQRKILRK
jgi:hypothetical protein